MSPKALGFSMAQFGRTLFGASVSMRVDTRKFCGRVRCIAISKKLEVIYLMSVKLVVRYLVANEHVLL